jgi:hypothetical protein
MSKKILSILFVLIIAVVVFVIWKRELWVKTYSTQVINSVPVNWLTYTNTQYGFEIKFPDTWKNYKAVETTDLVFNNVKYIEYALPTKDNKYYSMAGKGQITLLTVGIYPASEWQKAQSGKYGPKPILLGHNSKNYFGYYTQNINTTDSEFMKKDLQITEVVKTFKLTK